MHGLDSLDQLLTHLNSIHPNIELTTELKHDRLLPILDVITKRSIDGSIEHAVYSKTMNTNRYLNVCTHQHPAHKSSLLNTLIHPSRGITKCLMLGRRFLHVRALSHLKAFRRLITKDTPILLL